MTLTASFAKTFLKNSKIIIFAHKSFLSCGLSEKQQQKIPTQRVSLSDTDYVPDRLYQAFANWFRSGSVKPALIRINTVIWSSNFC